MKDRGSNIGASDGLATEADRQRLIALNTLEISRAAICRLGNRLDLWTGAHRQRPTTDVARELGLRSPAVRSARAMLAEAPARAEDECERAARLGARIITALDDDYPARLFDLALPPPVLYLRGQWSSAPAVAIVGSRDPDTYGRETAALFGRELAQAGAVVVSGFARGVDTAAHRGALAAEGGKTLAILGCGLGVDYPRGHGQLADQIAASGAMVSELPVGTGPRARHFPVRNRIIAALAQTVLVVRATARSGSLITARQALELGRDIAAIPGRIFARGSEGPNSLIRLGALLAQHPNDLLETLQPPLANSQEGGQSELFPTQGDPFQRNPLKKMNPGNLNRHPSASIDQPSKAPPKDQAQQRLLAALAPGETQDAEFLASAVGVKVEEAIAQLLDLELGGWIRREAGGVFSRRL